MAVRERLGKGGIKAPTNTSTLTPIPNIVAPPPQTALTDTRTNPTQTLGPTGIKFPFRFSSSGRVAVSTTTTTDASHIKESIEQILFTMFRERFFLPLFGSPLSELLYEPQTEFFGAVEYEIVETLEMWETRIQITGVSVNVNTYENEIIIGLEYAITAFVPAVSVTQVISLGS
jgi:phage baseplate assembly protein W